MLETLVPIGILLLVYGTIAIIAWRRPLLARLALREAVRRPRQSGLLVLGMMFGTAALLGMQGASDSVDLVFVNITESSWGRTDITVSHRGQPFGAEVANGLATNPLVARKVAGVQGGFVLVGSAADLDQRLSASPVQISTFDPTQPGFGSFNLNNGHAADLSAFGPDDAILDASLAGRLAAKQGDRVQINFVAGDRPFQVAFRVGGITSAIGNGFIAGQPGIHVPLIALQDVVGAGTVNVVHISALGNGQQEVDNARVLAPAVRSAVAALPGGAALEVREVKAQDLEATTRGNVTFRYFFLSLSLFVVLAATALVVNLALALAEERRPRLAVLRALGLSRSRVVLVALIEGAVYSLTAALIGTLPGLAYAYYVVSRPLPPDVSSVPLIFVVTSGSIAFSVCAGALITLLTILAVSIRTSRMAITSAIRDLPEPPDRKRRSWIRVAVAVMLAAAGAASWLPGNPTFRLLGGSALILAASMLATGRVSERVRATLMGSAVVTWSFLTVGSPPLTIGDIGLAFAAVAVSVFGAAVAISANLRFIERTVSLASVRLVATLRPPLAYLTRRPVRAGLSTGAFALILGALALFAVLIPSLGPDPRTIGGGYDLGVEALGNPNFTLPESLQSQVNRAESIKTLAYIGPFRTQFAGSDPQAWSSSFIELYALTDDQLNRPTVSLNKRDNGYASDAAVWRAIREDPSLVVASSGSLSSIHMVGPNGEVHLKIIGVSANALLESGGSRPGYAGSARTFTGLAPSGVGLTILVKIAAGVDARAFALELRRATFGQGVDTRLPADIAATYDQISDWYLGFFTLLLRTAVVVGVLSLGILALRAALERRRTIGVMRALGYRPDQVLAGMLVEATVAATVGIAVGIGIGLAIGLLFTATTGTIQGRVDFSQVVVPAIAIYAGVLLVTIGPALSASRMPTSEALRIIG